MEQLEDMDILHTEFPYVDPHNTLQSTAQEPDHPSHKYLSIGHLADFFDNLERIPIIENFTEVFYSN